MADARRTSPEEAHRKVESGEALLVCAYDDEAKCRQLRIDHAIDLAELQRKLNDIPANKEIIFYCA